MNFGQLWHLLRDHGYTREVLRGHPVRVTRKDHVEYLPRCSARDKVPEHYIVALRFQLDHRGILPKRLWERRAAKYKDVKTYG